MGFTDALGNAWNSTVNAVTNPTETMSNIAQDVWEAPKNFVHNVSETIDAPRLMDAIKDGSPKEVFDWGKENANGGVVPLMIDGVFGTHVSDVTSAFTKNLGDTLIDDSVNGLAYLGGLAQGGLEKIGMMPDLKQLDQALPDLDLYEDPDFDDASTAETIAGRAGQIAGFAVPFAGTAGALMKGGKAALGAYQEGHLLTSITDKVTDVFNSAKNALTKPGSKAADEADNVIPNAAKPAAGEAGAVHVDAPMLNYVKTAQVKAEIADEPFAWTNWEGKPMQAEAGDWKVIQPDGSVSSVKPDIFAETYKEVSPGMFAKTAITKAQLLDKPIDVMSLEGPIKGEAGDYLVTGPKGEQYVIKADFFGENYRPAAES